MPPERSQAKLRSDCLLDQRHQDARYGQQRQDNANVATGGGPKVVAGQPLPEEYEGENLELLSAGLVNLQRQIQNINTFGVPAVVSVNETFGTEAEKQLVTEVRCFNFSVFLIVAQGALAGGAAAAVRSDHYDRGGEGSIELAETVARVCNDHQPDFQYLYDLEDPIETKIEKVAAKMYGADGVDFSDAAKEQIARLNSQVALSLHR